MPPPHTHFTIKAPSPTTIQYTVSTSRPPHTLPSQLLHYASLILRLIIGLFTILILLQKVFFPTLPPPSPLLTLLSLTHLTTSITTTIPWPILLPLISTSLFLVFRRFHAGKPKPLFPPNLLPKTILSFPPPFSLPKEKPIQFFFKNQK